MTFPVRVEVIDPELDEVIRDTGRCEIDYHSPAGRGWLQGQIMSRLLSGLALKITPLARPRPVPASLRRPPDPPVTAPARGGIPRDRSEI